MPQKCQQPYQGKGNKQMWWNITWAKLDVVGLLEMCKRRW